MVSAGFEQIWSLQVGVKQHWIAWVVLCEMCVLVYVCIFLKYTVEPVMDKHPQVAHLFRFIKVTSKQMFIHDVKIQLLANSY